MKTLTIRGLPDEVHERLKEQAKRNRRSLNQEVIAELSDIEVSQKDFVTEMLAASGEVQTGVSKAISHGDVKIALEEMRERH